MKCNKCGVDKPDENFYNDNRCGKLRPICKECCSSDNKEWYKENAARKSATSKLWYANNPGRAADRGYKTKYGISLDIYNSMLEDQGARCKICSTDTPRGLGKFEVDHCHTTGKVRGLLCKKCNTGIGLFRDNPALLQRSIDYLRGA